MFMGLLRQAHFTKIFGEFMPTLVAKWMWSQDSCTEPPASVIWGDGCAATYADYLRHRLDTHELVETESGLECRIYPDIVGHVRYDAFALCWFVSGDGIETTALDLSDIDATDHEITAELYALPVVYKCHIHRGSRTSELPGV
jgi:hypothetical protein